jgi:hypothetical protein
MRDGVDTRRAGGATFFMEVSAMTVFDQPIHRPVAVALAVLAGGMTMSTSVVVVLALGPPDPGSSASVLGWLVLIAQVIGAVLLLVGAYRLAVGCARKMLVAGAAVQVAVCLAYLAYAFLEVDEAQGTDLFASTAAVFAALPLASAYLALRD